MISALALALTLMAAGAPAAHGPFILTCNMTAPDEDQAGPNARRMFRMGPGLFQQWKPADQKFGPNMCNALRCRSDKDRLEGEISSSSLILTISLDLANGRAAWRTTGASGLRATSGACSVKRDEPPAGAPPPAPG